MSSKILEARHVPGPRVAANTQDWWVAGKGRAEGTVIIVGTINGEVFEHVVRDTVSPGKNYVGARMASHRPTDRWVLRNADTTFKVGLCDGSVFSHAVTSVSPNPVLADPRRVPGPPVAAAPSDMHVLSIGTQLVVIRHDGGVFAHQLSVNGIEPAVKVTGPPVAANAQDRWVISGNVSVDSGDEIFVITSAGEVFAHKYTANSGGVPSIGEATKLTGPPVAAKTRDRWVLMTGGKIVVITDTGEVFVHEVV